jgi:uncharacterized protein (DUF1499 family)
MSGRALALAAVAVAGTSLAVLLAAGPGTRLGVWHFRTGLTLLRWVAYLAIAGALVSIAALVRGGARPLAGAALAGSLAALAVPLGFMQKVHALPLIHDITTDTEDPPRFVAIAPLRRDAPNPVEHPGPEVAAQQRKGYPDLGPITLPAPPAEVVARARQVAQDLGWEVVEADPAGGRLEATDTTTWFGFKDDVVVRVRPEGAGSRVDVRSKSRVGRSDVGANAARIRRFLEEMRPAGGR